VLKIIDHRLGGLYEKYTVGIYFRRHAWRVAAHTTASEKLILETQFKETNYKKQLTRYLMDIFNKNV
jgi:hypothetical protein